MERTSARQILIVNWNVLQKLFCKHKKTKMFSSAAPKTLPISNLVIPDDEASQPLVTAAPSIGYHGTTDNDTTGTMGIQQTRTISSGFITDVYQIRALVSHCFFAK